MLATVNRVRAAAGWPAVGWSNILAATDPLPSPYQKIMANHIISCRSRMNEALASLGVKLSPYTDPDLTGAYIRAVHVNEVQERAQ